MRQPQLAKTEGVTMTLELLIHTKLHLPFTRSKLVTRPRLQVKVAQGLLAPLTLIVAPAGFGKTTLLATCVSDLEMPVAWLSLDKDDNQLGRFLNYLVVALRQLDTQIGNEAAELLAATRQPALETVLTSLINDLHTRNRQTALVLDDYQFLKSEAVHQAVAFLLEHCPKTLHIVIATRSDPPLPLARLRARGQTVELRATDLSFTEAEAAQFLNEVMGLHLDAESIATLTERTEGWIAGLQMAALSMHDRHDVRGFIESFSGTNRYILDYLLQEVLANQESAIQRFLLHTSILDRLTAPLCDAVLAGDESSSGRSASILEYLERANIFLVALDDERVWYRYHHLFADLLRAQLQSSHSLERVAELHLRAADWHSQNGSILTAIHHASMASDDERVERFIEQNYRELVSRGEQSWMRVWTGTLSEELVYRRPWLCIYEALSHSWFGELDKAERLLEVAEEGILSGLSTEDAAAMQGFIAYVRSRVTAMRGDIPRAIEFCLTAQEYVTAGNLAQQLDTNITLGYEYFLGGDYANAGPTLEETIRSGRAAGAVINTVAASCLLARMYAVQGQLNQSYETYHIAARSIPETGGQHLGARALIEVGVADLMYERNELAAALDHVQQGLELLPFWDKADDWVLAYVTLARTHLAQANVTGALEAVEKACQLIKTRSVFSEARQATETAQVKLWLAQCDLQAAHRWAASRRERLGLHDRFAFEEELAQIALARVLITLKRPHEAIDILSPVEASARSAARLGRVIEIFLLKALALQEAGDRDNAFAALTESLTLAEPQRYIRIFLDEGRPMQLLLVQWLVHARDDALRRYATLLVSQFNAEAGAVIEERGRGLVASNLIEPLSERELEVLNLIALGRTNPQIARQLIVATGTVKAHTASIYRKLDVANRTEAVARARELGVLS